MKSKILFTIAFSTLLFACTKTDPNLVTITGEITNPIGESVTFSNQDTSYSTSANANGTFTISFDLDSSTYLRFEHGPEGTAMYVYPGDKIKLTIDTELFDETIEYKGSSSSSYLAKKYLLEEGNDFFGEVYYMSNTEEYKAYLDSYKNSVINEFGNITDSTFINSEITGIDKDIVYFIGRQEKLAEYSEDAKTYMWETRNIARDFNFYTALDSLNSTDFNNMAEQYSAAFQTLLNNVTDAEFIVTAQEKIKKTTDSWLERKTAVDNMPKEGDPAIDFNYPDQSGERFSLANFKGNLVYVDVWATWCGPCLREIPALKITVIGSRGDGLEQFSNVSFLGWIAEEEVIDRMKKAAIFVRMTEHDGKAISVSQALSVGSEVIWSYAYDCCHQVARDGNSLLDKIVELSLLIEKRGMKPNKENMSFAQQHLLKDKVMTNYVSKLKRHLNE